MATEFCSKNEFEALSDFRYRLRCFLRFSEELTHRHGVTNLQYLLLLHVKGYKGREWATIGELAEKLQSHHHGVVSLASRCEKLGLVARKRGMADKREVEIHLTPEGDSLVSLLASLHHKELSGLHGIFNIPEILNSQAAQPNVCSEDSSNLNDKNDAEIS